MLLAHQHNDIVFLNREEIYDDIPSWAADKLHMQQKEQYLALPLADSLAMYAWHGVRPGSFLTAVITNDLTGAIENADDSNVYLLKTYVQYVVNCVPGGARDMKKWKGIWSTIE